VLLSNKTFEIIDGLRRAKAADLVGYKTITAYILDQESKIIDTRELSLDLRKEPESIDVSHQRKMDRFMEILNQIKSGSTLPPIMVPLASVGCVPRTKFLEPNNRCVGRTLRLLVLITLKTKERTNMENNNNPYQKPQSESEEKNTLQEYSEINIFSSQGRIGRFRYLAYSVILLFLYILFSLMGIFTGGLTWLWIVFFLIPWQLFIIIQRIHDLNNSGWWLLFMFIPYINLLFGLLLLILPGTNGSNKFGLQPPPNTNKDIGNFFLSLFFISLYVYFEYK